MNPGSIPSARRYFPAIICGEYDSPIDALLALCVPRDEAMDLVVAAWSAGIVDGCDCCDCVLATVDGGRDVAALRRADGRWLACNAFLEFACATRNEAERRLQKLQKRGRRGCIGVLAVADEKKPAR